MALGFPPRDRTPNYTHRIQFRAPRNACRKGLAELLPRNAKEQKNKGNQDKKQISFPILLWEKKFWERCEN